MLSIKKLTSRREWKSFLLQNLRNKKKWKRKGRRGNKIIMENDDE